MFKKVVQPLSDGMAEAIGKSINKIQYVSEAMGTRPADKADGDVKAQDISGEEEVKTDASAKKAPARKGDKAGAEPMQKVKEEAELDEARKLSPGMKALIKHGNKKADATAKEVPGSLDRVAQRMAAKRKMKKEEAELEESSCGTKHKKEEMDPVNKVAVKKKFDDRKDKDIDNDGDVDSSDEYLHKRRKAISKALESKKPNASVDESAELEGLDENMSRVGKELEAYARKNGGIDKNDFLKAAMMMKKGQKKQLMKFVDDLDTEPREKILSLMDKDADRRKEYKAAQKAMRKEEVELDELSPATMDRYSKKAKMSSDRARNSATAKLVRGNPNISKEKDTIRKREKGMNMADRGQVRAFRKQYTKEEVELEENMVASLAKDFEKRLKKQGYSSRTQERERMATLAMAKKKGAKPADMKALDAAMVKIIDKLDEEVRLDEAKSDYTIYHKTFSSAVQHAVGVAKKRGFEVDEDEYDRKVAMGPRKPSKGKTNSYSISLTKGGKPVKQKLHMQVYYDEGRYELNMYIS